MERSRSKWYGKGKCRVADPDEASHCVLASPGLGGNNEKGHRIQVIARLLRLDASEMQPAIVNGSSRHERALLCPAERDPFSRERPQSAAEASRTLSVGSGGGSANTIVDEAGMVRVMEWQEAALLQGFPEDFVFAASWSRTWKMVAQAIPIQVGKAILQGVCSPQRK